MSVRLGRSFSGFFALALAALTACSGGSSAPSSPTVSRTATPSSSSSSPSSKSGLAELTLYVPAPPRIATSARAALSGRKRDYISPSTVSLIITVDQITSDGAPVLYSTTAYDLTGITVQPQTGVMPDCVEQTAAPTFKCQIFLNAPPTDSSHSDVFYIYAYNEAQGANGEGGIGGSIPSSFVPNGFVLAEDIGPNGGTGGEPVPSSTNANGIALNANSQLTFNLYPVVEQPLLDLAGQTGNGLITGAPGSGGKSNPVDVTGLDEAGNRIDTSLSVGGGDSFFINQPTVTTSDTSRFSASPAKVSTVLQGVQINYAPQTGDQPTSDTSTPLTGTATVTTVLQNGGFNGLVNYPIESQSVEVSPIFVYQQTPSAYANGQETETVYILTHDLETGTDPSRFAIQYYTNQPCGPNNQAPFANGVTYAGTGHYVIAQYTVGFKSSTLPTTGCTLLFSDGFVATTFVLEPPLTLSL